MAKTYEELLEQAAIIRDETAAGKNTATRVGGTITDAVDYVKELQDTYKGIHAEASEAKTTAAAAKQTAAEAKTNAGSARSVAQSAVLNANAANSTANEAKAKAGAAQEAANTAQQTAAAAQNKNADQDTRIAALLQDIPWEGYHMNAFTDTGEYHIHGESTDANDGLPILNSGTIDARLTVLDSSLTNGTGEKTDIVVTQILRLSNRMGGDGHVYVRTAQAATKSQLATPSSTAWSTWEKLMGMFEKNAVTNIADLDTYTTNGMYSGLFANTTLQTLGGLQFTPGDTFLLITVNGYAASAFGTPQLTQMLYNLPSKKGSGNSSARMYMRTAYWDKNAEPKAWVWANWDRLAMASEISGGGGGGSIEEYNRLIELIAANTTKISSVESTANSAKSAAETAKTAADTAQETANSAQETATAASTAAQEAKSAAGTAQETANEASTKITELSLALCKKGVISQVQTWTQAADNGYDYVMSGLVRGVIPQANIDLFTSAGAIFNEKSGYFELNGLTDISYEEMIKIYNAYNPNPWNSQQGMLVVKKTRTFLSANNDIILVASLSGMRLCYSLNDIEAINMISTHGKIKFNNLQLAWFLNFKLKNIQNIIDCSRVNNYSQAFEKCYSLVDVRLWEIIESVSFKDCARLSNNSILYMINNEAATSPITITLHADVYNRCMANEDILAALAAHTNISIASA